MSQTVIGIFNNASEAQDAVEQLVKKGFNRSDIDVSANTTGSGSSTGTSDYNSSTGSGNYGSTTGATDYSSTTGTSGYVAGAASGAANTVAGAASGAANTVGNAADNVADNVGESKIGRFFKSLFGGDDDDNDTRYSSYSRAAERGTIVTVHANSKDEAEDAADILDDYGAIDIDENSSNYSSGTTATSNLDIDKTANTGSSINVIEEQLQVGKRTVETGGVRLRSRIVERPVEESLRLREERVYVDRNPVNRLVTGDELTSFKEGTIELTESAEVPVVAKEAYVKEEVTLGKDVTEREETIRDTVRSTEVDVENITTDKTTNTSTSGYNTTSNSGTTGTSGTNL